MGWRTPGTRDRDAASLDCQLGERTVMHLTTTACSALSAITAATNRPTRQRVSTGRARGGRRGALLSRRTKGGFVPTIAHVHILLMLTSAASPDPSSCNARDNCVQPPAREAYQQLSAAGRRGSDKPCAPERHGSAVEQHARMARARCGTRSPWSNAPGEARSLCCTHLKHQQALLRRQRLELLDVVADAHCEERAQTNVQEEIG